MPSASPSLRSLAIVWGLVAQGMWACASEPPLQTLSTGDASQSTDDAGGLDASVPSPRPDGGPRLPLSDELIELPFGAEPAFYRIDGEAALGVLDLHLSIDTTASIGAEIDELRRSLGREILPGLRDRVPDVSVGVSRFEDFPAPPFGTEGVTNRVRADTPFELLSPITSDIRSAESAVVALGALGFGGDIQESGAEALWQIATGEGYEHGRKTLIEPFEARAEVGGGVIGGVGFREGALHVVLHVTDAPTQTPETYGNKFPGTHDLDQAADALNAISARVVSIVSGACEARDDDCDETHHASARAELEQLAIATSASTAADGDTCPHGLQGEDIPARDGRCPLVFDVSDEGEGLPETLVTAIVTLVEGIRFARVTAIAADDPLRLVERITPLAARRNGESSPEIADLLPSGVPDGVPDTFVDARAGAPLEFEVSLRNSRLAPRDVPQSFRIVLRILGDDLILEERTLRVVVPAGALPEDDAGRE
jgi:hypothetical protein